MAKKIVKVENDYWSFPKYAIQIKDSIFLLEDGRVFEQVEDKKCDLYHFDFILRKQSIWLTISNTRCVPTEVRTLLEEQCKPVAQILKNYEMAEKLIAEVLPIAKQLPELNVRITKAKGLLTEEEFAKEVMESAGLYGIEVSDNDFGKWAAFCSQQLFQLSYIKELTEKWCSPDEYSFLYREYDGCLMIGSRENDQYKQMLKKASKELPIKANKKEGLYLGDKDIILYSAYYQVELKKPLTKEYATEIAKKIKK